MYSFADGISRYLLISFCLFWNDIISNGQILECADEKSCANRELGSNYSILHCEGFQSCSNLVETIVSVQADCTGSQSCSNILSPYLDVGTLHCYGYESCAHSMFYSDGGSQCWGQKSCYKSEISTYANQDIVSNIIECRGVLSCAKSNITASLFTNVNTVSITASGMFSLYDSIIDATDGPLSLSLTGYYAGYNATIFCGISSDYSCEIECLGTGCYYSKVFCYDDNYCTISCNETAGNMCPLNITFYENVNDSIIDVDVYNPDIDQFEIEYGNNHGVSVSVTKYVTLNNSENLCLNVSEIEAMKEAYFHVCNDYKGCFNESYVDNNNKSICCQGTQACEQAKYSTNTRTYLNSQNKLDEIIRCDGEQSCYLTTIIANNSIDCGGYHSCQSGQLDTADITTCSGYYSCLSASITSANWLFCNGERSCYSASISGVANLYGFGFQAFDESTIRSSHTGAEMNIYLCAYQSGYHAEICCYEEDTCNVYCANEGACENVEISNEAECGNAGNVTFHYNSTISANVCQVYLGVSNEMVNKTLNESMMSTTMTPQTNGSTTTEMMESTFWNDSFINLNGSDRSEITTTKENSKGDTSNKNADSGLTIAVIIIATLVVVAIVGLGIFYFVRSKSVTGAASDEQKYKLLDKTEDGGL